MIPERRALKLTPDWETFLAHWDWKTAILCQVKKKMLVKLDRKFFCQKLYPDSFSLVNKVWWNRPLVNLKLVFKYLATLYADVWLDSSNKGWFINVNFKIVDSAWNVLDLFSYPSFVIFVAVKTRDVFRTLTISYNAEVGNYFCPRAALSFYLRLVGQIQVKYAFSKLKMKPRRAVCCPSCYNRIKSEWKPRESKNFIQMAKIDTKACFLTLNYHNWLESGPRDT
jgi:hypothetical protein